MIRLVVFIIIISLAPLKGQEIVLSNGTAEYDKALQYYNDGSYDLAYNYIQIANLTKQVSAEQSSVLEIKTLYALEKHAECMKLIEYCLLNLDYSLSELSTISEIKTHVSNDVAFEERVAVEKQKLADKPKAEGTGWESMLDKARSSLKTIIRN